MSLVVADPAPPVELDPYAPPAWLAGGRIPGLDGLRALAVLLVVYAHVSQTTGFPDLTGLPNLRLGHLGVEAFLVVSGFLITTLLLRELQRTGGIQVGRFCRARLLKIVPPLAGLLAVLAGLKCVGVVDLPWSDFGYSGTFTTNFNIHPDWLTGHTWTLSIQEHFYLIWPVLLATCALTTSRRLLWCCIVGCLLLRVIIVCLFPEYCFVAFRWTCGRIDGVATGCLLAFAAYEPSWRARLNRLVHDHRQLLLIGGLLVCSRILAGLSWRYWVGMSLTVHSACFAVLLWAVVQRSESLLGRCFDHPAAVALGAASFSLYIWQQLFLQPHVEMWWCAFPQNLLFAGLAALASYRLIEKPIMDFKQRQKSTARPASPLREEPRVEAYTLKVWVPSAPRPVVAALAAAEVLQSASRELP